VESLDKPLGNRVLQAMAQVYPDPVDLALLSMVTGCELGALQAQTARFIRDGLAQAPAAAGAPCPPQSARITDRGMAVAYGLAIDAAHAAVLLARLEAQTLRSLLCARMQGSRLPNAQIDELRQAIAKVPDGALMDAARVWAHQPVSDWRALLKVLIPNPQQMTAQRPSAAGMRDQTV
jgi:hypothetical protein